MNQILGALTAALTMGFLVGCNGTVADARVAGLPADFKGPGSYTVPAVPTVTFPVSEVHIEQGNDDISLYYELPADLAGQKTDVHLEGAPDATGAIQFSGTAGTSTCTLTTGKLSCREDLSGIQLGPPPASTGSAQSAAAAAFIADPIGVLDVPLPP
jgi:hypothetical protein